MAYDSFYAGLSTRASVNEILNLAMKTKDEAERIAVDIKESELNALNAAIRATLQADRAQSIADGINGEGSGAGANLTSIGVYSGIDYGVVGGPANESANINKAIDACGKAGGGVVIIKAIVPGDAIYIDSAVQIEHNNVTLMFESPIEYGPNGTMRISGSFMEIKRPGQVDLVALASDSTVNEYGQLMFTARAGQGQYIIAGDRLTLRGENDVVGNAIEKQTITVESVTGDVVVAMEDPEYTFRAVYPNSAWEPDWTTGTTASIVNFSAFTNFLTGPLVNTVEVLDASKLTKGDLVYLSDGRQERHVMSPEPSTLSSAAIMEHARISSITGNLITLDKPIVRQYQSQWKGGVSQMNAVTNSHIIIKDLSWRAPQTSRKNSAVGINFGDKCSVKIGSMRGATGRIGTAVRVAYSYDCTVYASQIFDALRYESAEGYGIVMYYSTFCRITKSLATGGRHNFLIQTCVSCDIVNNISTDDYISGIDLHGAGSINCRILNNRVTRSNKYSPGVNKGGAIRNGNTSHMIGDHGTLVAGNYIEGYKDIGECAALDLSPSSKDVIFRDNYVVDCDIGFRHYRVNTTAVTLQKANRVIVDGNTFQRVGKIIDTFRHPTSLIEELVLTNNKSIENSTHFVVAEVPKVTAVNNEIISPVNNPGSWGFDFKNSTDLYVTGNLAKDANGGVRIENCTNAKIVKNLLDFTRDNLPFRANGVNTGYIEKGNTLADSGGGGATIRVGTVTTGLPGTDASVVNSGTLVDAIFDFAIPRGDPGAGGGGGGANSEALDGLVGVDGGLPMFTGVGAMQRIPTGTTGRAVMAGATPTDVKTTLEIQNVNNTSDLLKPVSTATQTALNLKAPLVSPIFVGIPEVPHPLIGDDSKQAASTNWVIRKIAEIPAPPTGGASKALKRFAMLGDSLSGNNSDLGKNYTRGFMTYAQQFSGHRVYFDYSLNFGVGGETAAQIAARVGTVVTAAPDICLVEMGGNDVNQGQSAATIIGHTKTVVDALTAAGITVILCTIYPTAGTTNPVYWKVVAQVNQWILEASTRYNKVEVLDAYSVMWDNVTGAVKQYYTGDLTHPEAVGSWNLGKELGDLITQLVPVNRHRPLANPNDIYAADNLTGNVFTNPTLSGGATPTSWVANLDLAKGTTITPTVGTSLNGFNEIILTLGGLVTGSMPSAGSNCYTAMGHTFFGEVLGGTTAWNTTPQGVYMRDTGINKSITIEVEVENLEGVAAVGAEWFHLSSGGDKPSNGDGLLTVNAKTPTTSVNALALPKTGPIKLTLHCEPEAHTGKSSGYRLGLHIVTIPGTSPKGTIKFSRPIARAYAGKL